MRDIALFFLSFLRSCMDGYRDKTDNRGKKQLPHHIEQGGFPPSAFIKQDSTWRKAHLIGSSMRT